MIPEITQVTKERKFLSIETDLVNLTYDDNEQFNPPTMEARTIETKPDVFVEDTLKAEYKLINDIVKACEEAGNTFTLFRHRAIPEGLYGTDYYNCIVDEAEDLAKMLLFKSTGRFNPTYLVMSSDLLPMFRFTRHFRTNHTIETNGTCVVGKYKDIPVLVSPFLDRGKMLWGVNHPMNTGIVTFTNQGGICYKITDPKYFALLTLED